MSESTENLLNQIKLDGDSMFELKNVDFHGGLVSAPCRASMSDELAAMANAATVFLSYTRRALPYLARNRYTN